MTLRLIAFVAPLGFDTLAVAVALGLRGVAPWRPALVFAAFEALMPVVGLVLGGFVGARFATAAAVVGGVVLLAVGVHAFREGLEDDDESEGLAFDSLRAAALAGVGISLDELAVGFPLGTAHLPIAPLLLTIGLQAFVVTAGGIALGKRLGAALGRRTSQMAAFAAGIAFGVVGAWLILEAVGGRH